MIIHLGRLFDITDRPSGNLEGLKLTHLLEYDTYSSRRMRGIIMQVFLQIVVFSSQTEGYSRSVLTQAPQLFVNQTLVAAFSLLPAAFYFESTPVRTRRIAPTFVNA